MRRLWLAASLLIALVCLTIALFGCAPANEPAPSYLDPYKPTLQHWTVEDERDWAVLPRYEISVTLDVDTLSLGGSEKVLFTNRSDNDLLEICFRLYPNLLQSGNPLSVSSVTANGVPVNFELTGLNTVLEVHCNPPIEPGQVAELDIAFSLDIPDISDGWVLFGRSQNVISLPDFYPILAVYNSSGWHRAIPPAFADAGFADSAFYQVRLTTDPDQVIVCTGTILGQTTQSDGSVTTEMIAGPIREFVILTSPDYEVETTQAAGTEIRSYYLTGDHTAGLTALHRAASTLQVYNDMYGPYPFTVMTVAEAPLQFKGMEYSTLNLLGVDLYRTHRKQLSYLTIHEVGHQWWYSQVGSDPFNSPWLDEGLTEYSAYTYFWKTYGRETADSLRDRRWLAPYEYAKTSGADRVLAEPVSAYSSPKVYETMVYAKGALFFDALRRSVGDETYYAILKEYLRRYRFQNALPEDFFAVARDVSGRDLAPLIAKWILTAE